MIDRKEREREREKNIVVLGLPDENESLQGATEDVDKIKKVWEKIGADRDQIASYRRLGVSRRGPRPRPVLVVTMVTRDAKANQRAEEYIYKGFEECWRKLQENLCQEGSSPKCQSGMKTFTGCRGKRKTAT